MWSKTRWALEQHLADNLKNRVNFVYTTQRVNHKPWGMDFWVMYILIDGEVWFATNPQFYTEWNKRRKSASCLNASDAEDWNRAMNETIRETGFVTTGWINDEDAVKFIHDFLNVLSIDEAFTHDNYFIRLLAVLDKRVGKRRLRPLLDNIENEPEWFRKWIRLRCEAEGMCGEQSAANNSNADNY